MLSTNYYLSALQSVGRYTVYLKTFQPKPNFLRARYNTVLCSIRRNPVTQKYSDTMGAPNWTVMDGYNGDGGDNNDDANDGAGGTLVLVGIVGAILVSRE